MPYACSPLRLLFFVVLVSGAPSITASAQVGSSPGPIAVETIWAEHPLTLPAGTELVGCITYRVNTRQDVTKDEWVMEAITFQNGAYDTIYLDLVGNPELLETDDCIIVQLTERLTFQTKGMGYLGMGKGEIIEVTSLGKYSMRKRQ